MNALLKTAIALFGLSLGAGTAFGAPEGPCWRNDFSDSSEVLQLVGRGTCSIADGVFRSRDAYALFGDPAWTNYAVTFRARVPETAEQVQIWAGFRSYNRFDRYVVGLKGGLQDDLYLMRTGYMGTDELMGIRPLGFHPEPGAWYRLRIEVCGRRIRVFLNDETLPRIDITDPNGDCAPSGAVSLGGGWIETEFDDLCVTPLADDALAGVPVTEYREALTPQQKEQKRRDERAQYRPVEVRELTGSRTEIPLDGNWLFMPEYQLADEAVAVAPATDDADWHVMNVPDFWMPIRIWLHGETMGSPSGHQPKGVSDTYYQQETDRCENYTFDYRRTGAAWYRHWIDLPAEAAGKELQLAFDAVSKVAEVYVNGRRAGSHIGMFGDFRIDATRLLHPGRNLIAVKVTRDIAGRELPTSDAMENYYSSVRRDIDENRSDAQAHKTVLTDVPHGFYGDNPAGIWQPVKLVVSDPLRVEEVFIEPALDGASFTVTVQNGDARKRSFGIEAEIVDKQTGERLFRGMLQPNLRLAGGARETWICSVDGLQPKLWEPVTPNLYDFTFRLVGQRGSEIDRTTITSGFRTFEARDGFFWLNGRKYWLRGGNHIPFALRPNDRALADRFMQLMREGNVNSTRTHTTPWNELWVSAADRNGIAISFEGTWSWLMIHSTPIPDSETLDLWRTEWLQLMRKYRNHPSIFLWTVNNEMKFYDLDADKERAMEKFRIISDAVQQMRAVDPTRPISFDSNYTRRSGLRRFGEEFLATVDDGDIDDQHAYYNWYDFSLFRFFRGEFERNNRTPGRPLISQEMSTGYPNNETGHPTRSYQLIHQNPFTLIGYKAYDYADPAYFLRVQSFITGELAETLRRTGGQTSGIMHFAYMTWFRQCYDAERIAPYPTYYALQRALQPVLVSAELWGRNAYAGDRLPARICVVNDDETGRDLPATQLTWRIETAQGEVLQSGRAEVPAVAYYGRSWIEPEIRMPERLPAAKCAVKLKLTLSEEGRVLSQNEYDLLLAERAWNRAAIPAGKRIVVLDSKGMQEAFDSLGIPVMRVTTAGELLAEAPQADLCIVAGDAELSDGELVQLRAVQQRGGRLLLLNNPTTAQQLYPEYITGWLRPTEGDIVVMEREEHPLFDGLEPLELRYFNNGRLEFPAACDATVKTLRDERLTEIAAQMKIHAYIDGGKAEDRIARIESMRGLTLFEIADGAGTTLVSTLCTQLAPTDPVAGHLLLQMITRLTAAE